MRTDLVNIATDVAINELLVSHSPQLKPMHLFIDQYDKPEWARTIKELKEKVGPGRVFKIYVDKKDGRTVQVGTGIGRRWFNRYIPWEKERA